MAASKTGSMRVGAAGALATGAAAVACGAAPLSIGTPASRAKRSTVWRMAVAASFAARKLGPLEAVRSSNTASNSASACSQACTSRCVFCRNFAGVARRRRSNCSSVTLLRCSSSACAGVRRMAWSSASAVSQTSALWPVLPSLTMGARCSSSTEREISHVTVPIRISMSPPSGCGCSSSQYWRHRPMSRR
ncbi:hypothetical protein FQZ97_929840 [compost metagenome]